MIVFIYLFQGEEQDDSEGDDQYNSYDEEGDEGETDADEEEYEEEYEDDSDYSNEDDVEDPQKHDGKEEDLNKDQVSVDKKTSMSNLCFCRIIYVALQS